MLVVVIVSGVGWCVGRMVGQPGRQVWWWEWRSRSSEMGVEARRPQAFSGEDGVVIQEPGERATQVSRTALRRRRRLSSPEHLSATW